MDSSKDSTSKRNPNKYEGERSCASEMSSIQDTSEKLESDNASDQTNSAHYGVEYRQSDLNHSTSNEYDEQFLRLNDDIVTNCSNVVNTSLSGLCGEQSSIADSSSVDFCSPGDSLVSAKVSLDLVPNDNLSIPSTSNAQENAIQSGLRENRKRPSSLKLNQSNLDVESSSDTGNDDYSLGSEDGCIYTYRGGEHLADLPSSFFSLDMGLPMDRHLPISGNYGVPQQAAPNAREQGSRTSSPDMDFLEMDFDPGPSCDADTGDESNPDADLDVMNNIPEDSEPVFRVNTPDGSGPRHNIQSYSIPISSASQGSEVQGINMPSTSRGGLSGAADNVPETRNVETYGPFITHVNSCGQKLLVRRTMSHWPSHSSVTLHVSSGDLVSPKEILHCEDQHRESPFAYQINQGENSADMSSGLYHLSMAKKLMADEIKTIPEEGNISVNMIGDGIVKTESEGAEITVCAETPRIMVWSEREACERQVTQIATSACGATAVVNVFIVLGVPVNIERINAAVGTRQRANLAPLPRYLLSRAVAGCTAADLVNGIQRASDGLVTARFFPTYPERAVSLSHWLADWISLGAVPVVTLNLQVGCEGEIPDAWHHQMVFGVSSRGIYLCNPVECIPETVLWPRLTSPSVLLVRTRDALARYTTNTDLTPLMAVPDRRFHTFNVMGQVANVIREWRATDWSEYGTRTRHIRIPASYQAGVTVAALTGSEAHRRLMQAPNLPLLAPHFDPTIR